MAETYSLHQHKLCGANQPPVAFANERVERSDDLLQPSLLHILWDIILHCVVGMSFLEREGGREGGRETDRQYRYIPHCSIMHCSSVIPFSCCR